MTTPPIRLPSGVRDFLPRAAARRRFLAEQVMELFESWGYARIITPVFECADVLERGLGAGAKAAAIRFVEPGTGEVVALRPDITPQIARVVATRLADVPGPIRLCYEGAVTRLAGDAGQREILQAGIELVDAPRESGDAEVLAVASAVLGRLKLGETRLDVGHVAPARYVFDAAPDAKPALVAAISRKDRAGVRAAARALPDHVAPLAEALVGLWGSVAATIVRARALPWPPEVMDAFAQVERAVAGSRHVDATVDFGDLRGFDYYTGIRFAGYAAGAPDAILRGGRYDELIGRYGRDARAIGFAIDLEAVAQAQRAAGIAAPVPATGVVVGDAAIAEVLRQHGLRSVVQAEVQGSWGAWLRGAGFDAAVVGDRMIRADDSERSARAEIQAARAGDIAPLIALIKA